MEGKEYYRKIFLRKRDEIPKEEKKMLDNQIFYNVTKLDGVIRSETVASYVSKDNEVDTHKLIKYFLNDGKKVLVPYIEGKNMFFSEVSCLKDLELGHFNILEPKNKKPSNIYESDMIIVPGIVFDDDGYRIGYGGGYFDRVLSRFKKSKIGVAYEIQILEEVPREDHDVPVDIIVTEKRVIKCGYS